MKTKIEIINEVATHFNLQNRAIDFSGEYSYITEEGKKCAVGMFLSEKLSNNYNAYSSTSLFGALGFEILKDEYRIESIYFWSRLQSFHDDEENWSDGGLSEQGEQEKQRLLNTFKN